MNTSLWIRPKILAHLDVLVVQRRCRINYVAIEIEAIENPPKPNGRRAAT